MPTVLDIWVAKWNINPEAVVDLKNTLGALVVPRAVRSDKIGQVSEAAALQAIRLEAPAHGVVLLRNNVGMAMNPNGQPIRFGLGNESAAINKVMKTADYIGITPKIITEIDIGSIVGVFTSYEGKRPGWKYSGNAHEAAQLNWATFVVKHGGIAQFATGPRDIWPL